MINNNNKVLYFHLRKRDNEVFYVGIGNDDRAYAFNKSVRSNSWNKYVKKNGTPKVVIIKRNLTTEKACNIEKEYIKKIGRINKGNGTLVNLTAGGETGSNSDPHGIGVICLNTGEIYKSISKYCKDTKQHHAKISQFLNTTFKYGKSRDLNVRIIKDNAVLWNTPFDKKDFENNLTIDDVDLIENNKQLDVKRLFNNLDKKYIMAILIKNIYNKTFKEFKTDFGFDIQTVYYTGLNKINKPIDKKTKSKGCYTPKLNEIEDIYNGYMLIKEYSSLLNYLISDEE